jgi:hypothetical protein
MSVFPKLIVHIFQQLADDKHTLSTCMRVSSTINSLVAPILYRSIKLTGSTGIYDHTSTPYPQINIVQVVGSLRMTRTKAQNLAFIKNVKYIHHQQSSCLDTCRPAKLSTSLLELTVDPLNPTAHDGWSACRCTRNIMPDKLVMHCTPDKVLTSIRRSTNKTVILGNQTVQTSTWEGQRVSSIFLLPPIQQLVLIFWSTPPGFNPNPYRRPPDPWAMSTWKHFQTGMFQDLISNNDGPKGIVLVNIESIIADHLDSDGDPRLACDISAQNHQERLNEMLEQYTQTLTGTEEDCRATLEKARNTKFTFVTMRDYPSRYNWLGEFEKDKSRPWVEIMG